MSPFTRHLLIGLLAALCANGPAWAQDALPRHEIAYKPYEGSARRIIVRAVLNDRVEASLAIDTGAPHTVISAALAERLGLLDKSGVNLEVVAGGIGGRTPAILSIIDTIRLGDAERQFFPTTIVTTLSSNSFEGLIGMDFLAAYSTQIDPKRNVFILQELPAEAELYGGHDEQWWRSTFRTFASFRQSWRDHHQRLDQTVRDSRLSGSNETTQAVEFAGRQVDQADRLLDRLNSYAVRNQVPMHWRDY